VRSHDVFPSRDSSASAGWSRAVAVARPPSRGVVVLYRVPVLARVAPHGFGRSLPALTLAGPGFEVFRERVTFPSKPEKDPLVRFDSPSEYCRGALPERPSPLLPPAFADARVRLSWGSSSLRRDHSGCPALPRSVTRPREAKGANPPPGSALGVLPPLGGLSRAGDRRARVAPLPPTSAVATPRSSAALFHAANVPGIRPPELSPPEEPCRREAAVASLRVRSRP
jgi:hypothetical protein